jgi:NTE family protein
MCADVVSPKSRGYEKQVALVLQGGGALGSYQAGVYEALANSPYQPDWVAGISIGAINAAIIAGNAPNKRVERLREFWEGITAPTSLWRLPHPFDGAERRAGSMGALLFGQPGFFSPRPPMDWVGNPKPLSFYDTDALRGTLDRLVDFDRINARETRFSVGAVNVRTGHFAYFDNDHTKIRAEHIMASGALPPGFPSVEIDGEFYWDGGLVSNTPLQQVLNHEPRVSRLTFQVDLFQAFGNLPTTLDEVAERDKDIRYASRTRASTKSFQAMHNIRSDAHDLWLALPEAVRALPEAKFLEDLGCMTEMDIVELIYRPFVPQGSTKDFEFSRVTMQERWDQGREDAEVTLRAAPWLAPVPPRTGARLFDVLHDIYVAELGDGTKTSKKA